MGDPLCPSCASTEIRVLYDAHAMPTVLRPPLAGSNDVLVCFNCLVQFLTPFPDNRQLYEKGKYWDSRIARESPAALAKKHSQEQTLWLARIGPDAFVDRDVLDFGCGHGFFLDMVRSFARSTSGCDADVSLQGILEENGHTYFSDIADIPDNSVDLLVSFDTLEHLEQQVAIVREIARVVRPSGWAYIGVPNSQEFLLEIEPRYIGYFYKRSHLVYHCAGSLTGLFERGGFASSEISFVHKYNMMNMVGWLQTGKPQGLPDGSPFDSQLESAFRAGVEADGRASHVLWSGQRKADGR